MSNMVSHVVLCNQNVVRSYGDQFNPSALDRFDGMKVVLEQTIYYNYLRMIPNSSTVEELKQNITKLLATTPGGYGSYNTQLDTLYSTGLEWCKFFLSAESPADLATGFPAPLSTLFEIFRQPPIYEQFSTDVLHRPYMCTMTEDFLAVFVQHFMRGLGRLDGVNPLTNEVGIYIPSVKVSEVRYPVPNSTTFKTKSSLVIELAPLAVSGFRPQQQPNPDVFCIHCFLNAFNLRPYTVEDLIGILASFVLDHDQYVMTNQRGNGIADFSVPYFVAEVCFDLVTRSSFSHKHRLAGNQQAKDLSVFLKTLKSMVDDQRINTITDYGLFGELLAMLGVEPNIVNYFVKPITTVSSMEALAFRNSELATFIPDRFEVGMEAMSDDTTEVDNTSGDESGETQDDTAVESGGVDDTSGEDHASTAESEAKPEIDPRQMLVELVQPNETLSDYIYRDLVARRISDILTNPPMNIKPSDLLLLKRWRSRWLYLVSIACLRDFLTRISVRISDV
jgi:hypothetical protein